jgi:hypothetical protein
MIDTEMKWGNEGVGEEEEIQFEVGILVREEGTNGKDDSLKTRNKLIYSFQLS